MGSLLDPITKVFFFAKVALEGLGWNYHWVASSVSARHTRIPPSDSEFELLDSDSDVVFLGRCPIEYKQEIVVSKSE